jgi:hypothetical protein
MTPQQRPNVPALVVAAATLAALAVLLTPDGRFWTIYWWIGSSARQDADQQVDRIFMERMRVAEGKHSTISAAYVIGNALTVVALPKYDAWWTFNETYNPYSVYPRGVEIPTTISVTRGFACYDHGYWFCYSIVLDEALTSVYHIPTHGTVEIVDTKGNVLMHRRRPGTPWP